MTRKEKLLIETIGGLSLDVLTSSQYDSITAILHENKSRLIVCGIFKYQMN